MPYISEGLRSQNHGCSGVNDQAEGASCNCSTHLPCSTPLPGDPWYGRWHWLCPIPDPISAMRRGGQHERSWLAWSPHTELIPGILLPSLRVAGAKSCWWRWKELLLIADPHHFSVDIRCFQRTFSLICKCYIQSLFCLASFAETLKNTTRAQTRLASLGMCKEHPCPAIQPAYVKAHPSSHLWKVYLNI